MPEQEHAAKAEQRDAYELRVQEDGAPKRFHAVSACLRHATRDSGDRSSTSA
jgi:hypothetical protein